MRPSRIASLACLFVALGQTGCCHWWHHRHCCYPPAPDTPPVALPVSPAEQAPPHALTGRPGSDRAT